MYHIYGDDAGFLTVKLDCYWTDKTADFNYQSQSVEQMKSLRLQHKALYHLLIGRSVGTTMCLSENDFY